VFFEYIYFMKIFKIIFGFIISFSIIFTIVFGGKQIEMAGELKQQENQDKPYLISLWHIEGFEGGRGSRKKFLEEVSLSFEKKQKNAYIMVFNLTIEGAEENIKKDIYPDLISYSIGTNVNNLKEIQSQRSFKGGNVGNKCFSLPWCKGGYVLIKNKNCNKLNREKILVSSINYTNPMLALYLENINTKNASLEQSKKAYLEFINGKAEYLLGTQRDLVRLENANVNVEVTPIQAFNDLYQYIGIMADEEDRIEICNNFINYLCEDENQQKLSKISMFSEFVEVNHQNEKLNILNKANKNCLTLSPYLDKLSLTNLQTKLSLAINGDKNAIDKIKNMLF